MHGERARVLFRSDATARAVTVECIRWSALRTTVPHGELGSGLLASMLRELGIDREEF